MTVVPYEGRPLRVLHIVQNLNYGGMERLIADIARNANRQRLESHVLALQYLGRFASESGEGTRLHLAEGQRPWSLLWPRRLATTIARISPDVVHTHSGVWYKAALAARLAGVPRVLHTEHGRRSPDPLSDRAIDRLAARRTDVVVAVSSDLEDTLRRGITGRTPVRVIPNGVDTKRFRAAPPDDRLRFELGINGSTPVLGSIGRLEPIKGYDVMIAAFAILLSEWSGNAPPVLLIAGDGSERQGLERLAGTLGVRQRVHFLGWRDDVTAVHRSSTLFTLSSHSEGTSVSLLEAMSARLCPVVTEVGGNRDVLGPALRHRLVAAAAPAALARAWSDALNDPVRREADGKNAATRVEAAFGIDRMVGAYEELYLNPKPHTHVLSGAVP